MEALRKQKVSSTVGGKVKLRKIDRIGKNRVIGFPNHTYSLDISNIIVQTILI
jgi:hypothetical protein